MGVCLLQMVKAFTSYHTPPTHTRMRTIHRSTGSVQGCVRGRHGHGKGQGQGQIISDQGRRHARRMPMKSYVISEAP